MGVTTKTAREANLGGSNQGALGEKQVKPNAKPTMQQQQRANSKRQIMAEKVQAATDSASVRGANCTKHRAHKANPTGSRRAPKA